MNISREWLQTFFDKPLPDAQALADALTFHAFEIESVESNALDVKVTPNRGHDALSHRGIARELSAILKLSMKNDPLRTPVLLEPKTDAVKVTIEDTKLCSRFTGAYIRNVHIGSSPAWLQKSLEAVEQKSINNVVDVTNYVMFGLGQPLHAFDIGKLKEKNGSRGMAVRLARSGETLMGLDDKEYDLAPSMLVIEDANASSVISIAGIKGGKPTGIDEVTTDIFLEAANWDGVTVRKTSQMLKLRTDASERFQQVISPEYAAYGLSAAANLITELAGGEIVGFVDEYPEPEQMRTVTVSPEHVNNVLGTSLSEKEVEDVFARLNFSYEKQGGAFSVQVPFERLDICIPEDLVEEVGRIVGYDKVPVLELPPLSKKPEVNGNFYVAEKTREELISQGYSEVYTSVFGGTGVRQVLNKVGGGLPGQGKSYLRANLTDNLTEALARNIQNKDLLGLKEIKLFEIGTVWPSKDTEEIHVATISEKEKAKEWALELKDTPSAYDVLPLSTAERYQSFSKYPYIVRDIAMWTSAGTNPDEVLELIRGEARELLVRSTLFDRFEKGEKLSLAFRLIFQSFERTLTDEEVNVVMKVVTDALTSKGFQIR